MKFSGKTKLLMGTAAGIGLGAAVVDRYRPVSVPARGGIMRMSNHKYRSIKRKVQRGDGLAVIGELKTGLNNRTIRYYKYPTGSSSVISRMSKQSSEEPLRQERALLTYRLGFSKEGSLIKRVLGNVAAATSRGHKPVAGPVAALHASFKKNPGISIPLFLGGSAVSSYAVLAALRASRDRKYRQAVEQGTYPSGRV